MAATDKNFWIFQYNHKDRTGRDLVGPDGPKEIDWLWRKDRKTEPQTGDAVLFLRAGDRRDDKAYPKGRPWRGFTGVGAVTGPVRSMDGRQSDVGVPVETLAFSHQMPLADWQVWHDHRLATVSVVYGQQGTNFAIPGPAAQAISQAMQQVDAQWARIGAEALELGTPQRGDALSRAIEDSQSWLDSQAALSLQSARALSTQTRRGALTWIHLLIGLIAFGRDLNPRFRQGALAAALYEQVSSDPHDSRLDAFLNELVGGHSSPVVVDRRNAAAVDSLSTSATEVLRDAKALSRDRLITAEALLAAVLRSRGHQRDDVFRRLFQVEDANALAALILNSANERSRPNDLEQFWEWLGDGRTVSISPPASRGTAREKVTIPTLDDDLALDLGEALSSDEGGSDYDPTSDEAAAMAKDFLPDLGGGGIAQTVNDTTKRADDYLDVKREAEAFARLIASSTFKPPLAVGIFGPWGTGKTFFMERIDEALDKITKTATARAANDAQSSIQSRNEPAFLSNIVRVHFNAWHYMETNVWASLVNVIFKELDRELRKRNTNGGEEDKVTDLFEKLSTAQISQLDAIEAVADRLADMETAQRRLESATEARTKNWASLAKEYFTANANSKAPTETLKAVSDIFGLQHLTTPGAKLQAAMRLSSEALSDARSLWPVLSSRLLTSPEAFLLAASILVVPIGVAALLARLEIEPTVSSLAGLITVITGWSSMIARRAKQGVAALQALNDEFEKAEQVRLAKHEKTLADVETSVNEAQRSLSLAEQAAASAYAELRAGSTTGRMAAFIRSRAESDIYSRHLGIIDTVRRDFEQLTVLLANPDDVEKEKIQLEKWQSDLRRRIEDLKKRFGFDLIQKKQGESAKTGDTSYLNPVREALDRISDRNTQEKLLDKPIDRIVLFIDDLDRCPPEKVYHVLQAVHLFMNFPLFVIVVGVDTQWMERSLVQELGKLVDGESGASAQDYLEKIFQIPYWTRAMDAAASTKFADGILNAVKATDQHEAPPPPDDPKPDGKVDTNPPDDELNGPVDGLDSVADDLVAQERADATQVGWERSLQSLTTDRPVDFSEEERTLIRLLAPYAGRSPRQLLRFVNVYGLIKSVMIDSDDRRDEPGTLSRTRAAMLAQLAISTGSPTAAKVYFDALASGVKSWPDLLNLIEQGREKAGDAEIATVREVLFVAHNYLEGAITGSGDQNSGEASLLACLRETAPIARRYTFAAIGVSRRKLEAGEEQETVDVDG